MQRAEGLDGGSHRARVPVSAADTVTESPPGLQSAVGGRRPRARGPPRRGVRCSRPDGGLEWFSQSGDSVEQVRRRDEHVRRRGESPIGRGVRRDAQAPIELGSARERGGDFVVESTQPQGTACDGA